MHLQTRCCLNPNRLLRRKVMISTVWQLANLQNVLQKRNRLMKSRHKIRNMMGKCYNHNIALSMVPIAVALKETIVPDQTAPKGAVWWGTICFLQQTITMPRIDLPRPRGYKTICSTLDCACKFQQLIKTKILKNKGLHAFKLSDATRILPIC